ncbi:MAG: FMN-binding negative transcriptional regulator [Betaproteobacteria bacterium]|jgi:transcriptional regulator|nr:transcriptional regulator [Betaproteobacteria bacterium UKL13-2]HCG53949.1 transcriptional regulator [Betaproteobacteria bacterium]
MYLPTHFAETRAEVLQDLIRTHPLATLVHLGTDGLAADHIPLMLHQATDGQITMRGHVARANPIWSAANGKAVLAVFQGPHAYISPSWYASKAEHGKVVPTWNYAVVHVHGVLTAIDDFAWFHAHASAMTERNEASVGKSWKVTDAPDDYIRNTARAIVGIEIAVERIEGKWKMSQNRSAADRAGVAAGLASVHKTGAASAM